MAAFALVGLALAMDEHGISIGYEIYPSKCSEHDYNQQGSSKYRGNEQICNKQDYNAISDEDGASGEKSCDKASCKGESWEKV